jgi:hypothetical protein
VDRSRAITRKTTLDQRDGEFERSLWDGWTPSQKLAEAWRLSEELWRFARQETGERGLSRSVARVVRR